MNERIKELVRQAGITTNLDTDFFEKDPNKWVDYFSEKFAELIVRECLKEIKDMIVDESERLYPNNKQTTECVNAVMDGTKEGDHYALRIENHFDNSTGGILHFGVEE